MIYLGHLGHVARIIQLSLLMFLTTAEFLYQLLRCPFCGGKFNITGETGDQTSVGAGYGILTCYCSRFPVVAGIPILQKGENTNEVVSLIETGQNVKALLTMISPKYFPIPRASRLFALLPHKVDSWFKRKEYEKVLQTWHRKASVLLMDQKSRTTACELIDFYMQNKEVYYYFAYRFGQPRHLVALSFATLIQSPRKAVLDLSCGCGHITRNLVYRANNSPVVGVDRFFLGLYIAKHWIAPQAEYVCCSFDTALPFPDGSFSAIMCSDAFHYSINKVTTISELKRLVQNEGLIMLVWVRNALESSDGSPPLSPEGYQSLLSDVPHRLVSDRDVLSRYLQKEGPQLAQATEIKHLHKEPTLSIVASHQQEIFRNYGQFDKWPHGEGRLRLNPLYKREDQNNDNNIFIRRFPSRAYEEKHKECKDYLPERIEIASKLLNDLVNGEYTPDMENLIRQCVILDIPERFI